MLKAEIKILFVILLLLEVQNTKSNIDWVEIISCSLSFLCGLSVNTWIESRNNTLTSKTFFRRLLLLFGLIPMIYYIWNKYKFAFVDVIVAIFIVTALCEWIASIIIKAGKIGFRNALSNYLKLDKKELQDNE